MQDVKEEISVETNNMKSKLENATDTSVTKNKSKNSRNSNSFGSPLLRQNY